MNYKVPLLPLKESVETKAVLKQVAKSERVLGELKGVIQGVPNESILLNTLFLQEAKASSEIENIITTDDEVFRSSLNDIANPNAKEVQNYNIALFKGFEIIKQTKLLRNNDLKTIQKILKNNDAGFRAQTGTTLKNSTEKVIYTPPQNKKEIEDLMSNLEIFINDDEVSDLNLLIKMSIIHHQFESIHPFYDGNGRTGRIINILYLSLKGLLDIPVLYLSRYIIDNKSEYYTLLQETREKESWEAWLLFMLEGIEETARQTVTLIQNILTLMQEYKVEIREKFPAMYSQDMINVLFKHPYTKIEYVAKELNCHRQTAGNYLNDLSKEGYLKRERIGKSNYYINEKLCQLFIEIRELEK